MLPIIELDISKWSRKRISKDSMLFVDIEIFTEKQRIFSNNFQDIYYGPIELMRVVQDLIKIKGNYEETLFGIESDSHSLTFSKVCSADGDCCCVVDDRGRSIALGEPTMAKKLVCQAIAKLIPTIETIYSERVEAKVVDEEEILAMSELRSKCKEFC